MRSRDIILKNFITSEELSEVKVIYKSKQRPKVKICNSMEAYDQLITLFDKNTIEYQEQFYMLLLNRANFVIGWIKLSIGGTAGTVVDPKIVFTLALKTNASSIILCHNHPSGNLKPSEQDITLTRNINKGGEILGVKLLDHLIVSNDNQFYSLSDEGIIP